MSEDLFEMFATLRKLQNSMREVELRMDDMVHELRRKR